ncbi:hypothetical protein GKO46_00580 [SAR202 cluster bacterium JH702]|uniref:Uncharacterized protein n=1 Tax=Candidatus Lucifugimonas marina TaxID=3038979 RepID=A0ABD4XLP3_9CHLR|nr:hypothetical protein [SAR202 cluster bacterium JH702]
MSPRNNQKYPQGTSLIARGRQALMTDISPEFLSLDTITGFIIVRYSPRMTSSQPGNRPS